MGTQHNALISLTFPAGSTAPGSGLSAIERFSVDRAVGKISRKKD
jgi:hypothetical protein